MKAANSPSRIAVTPQGRAHAGAPNRASRRAHARHQRRRGQALILAVLLMLFTALLGATVIGVVSVNLNQTARVEDRSVAEAAANAGIKYVNEQLTYSPQGSAWFDSQVQPTIPTGGAAYNLYFTAMDKAQGWAGQFAKYPDPRQANDKAPQFLFRVDPAGDPQKPRMKKITVVGLSPDDPGVFQTRVAYKDLPFNAMREIGNFDWANKRLMEGSVDTASVSQVTIKETVKFPEPPFSILVGGPNSKGPVTSIQRALVTGVSGKTLTFGNALAVAPTEGDPVQVAAEIGGPPSVDFVKDGQIDSTYEVPTYAPSRPDDPAPGSIRSNAALFFTGNFLAPNLDANFPGKRIETAGLIATDGTSSIQYTGTTSGSIPTSSSFANSGEVRDGWSRFSEGGSPLRNVQPQTPPNFTNGSGVEKYRNMTRYAEAGTSVLSNSDSSPTLSGSPESSLFGYGRGRIYIDNVTDKEKIFDSGTLRDMSQKELKDMLFSNDTSAIGGKNSAVSTTKTESLEQQHLRGWVSHNEFVPRGVLIDLSSPSTDPYITITRDGRADNLDGTTDFHLGGVVSKAWKNETGSPINGLYSRRFKWPTSGDSPDAGMVIFAEGNVRVRGVTANNLGSLTIVSMNNIYIEGSTAIGNGKKLLLLAKKNVILNPTRLLGSIDTETTLSPAAPLTALAPLTDTSIDVVTSAGFAKGDVIQVEATPDPPIVAQVTGIPSSTELEIRVWRGGTPTTGGIVRTQPDAANVAGTGRRWSRVVGETGAIQRHWYTTQSDFSNIRLLFDHAADKVDGLEVSKDILEGNVPGAIPISFKRPHDDAVSPADYTTTRLRTVVKEDAKYLYGESPIAPTEDKVPSAFSPGLTLQDFATALVGTTHSDSDVPPNRWAYGAVVSPALPSAFLTQPYWILAGVGIRYPYNASPVSADWRALLDNDTKQIPLATSIQVLLNGAQTKLSNPLYLTGEATDINQIGFDGDKDAVAVSDRYDDALTTDEGFYQEETSDGMKTTLDSKGISTADLVTGLNTIVLQQTKVGVDLPTYRLRALKLEKLEPGATVGFSSLEPGDTIEVSAFVMAQEGSWLVIAGDAFAPRVVVDGANNRSYINLDSAPYEAPRIPEPGEYFDANGNSTWDSGDFADLNRNGVMDPEETPAALAVRMSRMNYAVKFTGAIYENQSALINDEAYDSGMKKALGLVQDWTNAWASVSMTDLTDADTATGSVIEYTFDTSIADGTLDNDSGFILPQTPDLVFQG